MKSNSLIILLVLGLCYGAAGEDMGSFDPVEAAKKAKEKAAEKALLSSPRYKHWITQSKINFKLPAKNKKVRLYLKNGDTISGLFKEVSGDNVILKKTKRVDIQVQKSRLTPKMQRTYFIDEYVPYNAKKRTIAEKDKGALDDARSTKRKKDDKKGIAYDIARAGKALLYKTVGSEVSSSVAGFGKKMDPVVKIGMKKATGAEEGYIIRIAYMENDLMGRDTVGRKTIRHAMIMSKAMYEGPKFFKCKDYVFEPHLGEGKDKYEFKPVKVGTIKISRSLAAKMFKKPISEGMFLRMVRKEGTIELDASLFPEKEEDEKKK